MLTKRGLGYDPESVAPHKRLRLNVADLFLGGGLSGQRTQTIFTDAGLAGAEAVGDLDGAAGRNSNRNILRKLKKGNKWPKFYDAEVRVKNPKTDEVPHETHFINLWEGSFYIGILLIQLWDLFLLIFFQTVTWFRWSPDKSLRC